MAEKQPSAQMLALWHRVASTPYLGPVRFKKLLKKLGANIGEVFEMSDAELTAMKGIVTPQVLKGIRELKITEYDAMRFANEQIKKALSLDAYILLLDDPRYPSFLYQSNMCHPILYCKGDVSKFASYDKSIAIVGSRDAAPKSLDVAKQTAFSLAEEGWVIVSGMAKGIDAAAHEGALNAEGRTIAVLGGGVDVPYPKECIHLYDQISESNLVVSEYPLGSRPEALRLKKRNKTTVAFSLGAFIVQSAKGGGAMNALRGCSEQHKPAFAWDREGEVFSGNRAALEAGGYAVTLHDAVSVVKRVLLHDSLEKRQSLKYPPAKPKAKRHSSDKEPKLI